VGVALWDGKAGIGGMSHILLPNEDFSIKKDDPEKFANQAIEIMVEKMVALGAVKRRIVAKIAGGARMFSSINPKPKRIHVGKRNVIAVKEKLGELKVPIVAEDVGGTRGRTMEFDTSTGKVVIHLADGTTNVL
jgi:chemotaxis protein CheD